jgi:hypothetical protein
MKNYNQVMTSLLANEKLIKENSNCDTGVAQYKSLVESLLYILSRLDSILCILRDYCLGLCINRARHILELQKEF